MNFSEWFELNEQTGNIVVGYHRTRSKEITDLINQKGFIIGSGDYGPAVYFTLQLDRWLQPDGIRFGDWLVAAKIDTNGFLIFDRKMAEEKFGTNSSVRDQIAKLYPQFQMRSNRTLDSMGGQFNWELFQQTGLNKFVPGVIMNAKGFQTWALVFNPKVAQPYKVAYHPSPETPLKWEGLDKAAAKLRLSTQKDFDPETWKPIASQHATHFNQKPAWGRVQPEDMRTKLIGLMLKHKLGVSYADTDHEPWNNLLIIQKPIADANTITNLRTKYPFVSFSNGKVKLIMPSTGSELRDYDHFFRDLSKAKSSPGIATAPKPQQTIPDDDFALDLDT